MKKNEAIELLSKELKVILKTFKSEQARALCIIDFLEGIGMRPPAKKPQWEREYKDYNENL